MIQGRIYIDDVSFLMAPGFSENIKKDIELDDAIVLILGVSSTDIERFSSNKPVDILLVDAGGGLSKTRWLISIPTIELVSRSLELYDVTLQLAEYTQKLQNDTIIGKSFKQPNDLTLTRYTSLNIIERLLHDSVLWDTDYIIDPDSALILNAKAANFDFVDMTLFEAMSDVFKQYDAIPRLVRDYTFNRDVIVVDRLNSKNNSINKAINTRLRQINQDSAENVTSITTRLENMLDTEGYNVTIYPSDTEFISIKSNKYYVDKTSDAFIPTGGMNIKSIEHLYLDFNSLDPDLTVDVYIITGATPSFQSVPISDFSQYLPTDFLPDCVRNVVETEAFEILTVPEGEIIEGITKNNTLEFTRFAPNIFGINYDDRGYWRADTDVLFNMIFTTLLEVHGLDMALAINEYYANLPTNDPLYNSTITSFAGYGTDSPGSTVDDVAMAKLGWRIAFQATNDVVVTTERTAQFEQGDDKNLIKTKFINQTSRSIDAKKAGKANTGLVERMGNKSDSINKMHDLLNDRYVVGDYDDNYIISNINHIYHNNNIESLYEFNKNFNRLGSRTQIDTVLRTSNIPSMATIDAYKFSKSYLLINDEETGGSVNTTTSIDNAFLGEFFNTNDASGRLMVYAARRIGADWDGTTKYTNTSTAGKTDGFGSTVVLLPLISKVIGKVLVLGGEMLTNSSAGDEILPNRDKNPISIVYTGTDDRYQGEFEYADFSIGYGSQNITSTAKQLPLISLQSSITPIATDFYVNENLIQQISYPVFKDRNERIIQQYLIEAKAIKSEILIYPGFMGSHRITGKESLTDNFKYANLNTTIDYSITNIGQISSENIISSNNTFVYNKTSYYIALANLGNPYVIYDATNGDILLANNQPVPTVGVPANTNLYFKLKENLENIA